MFVDQYSIGCSCCCAGHRYIELFLNSSGDGSSAPVGGAVWNNSRGQVGTGVCTVTRQYLLANYYYFSVHDVVSVGSCLQCMCDVFSRLQWVRVQLLEGEATVTMATSSLPNQHSSFSSRVLAMVSVTVQGWGGVELLA